MAASSHRARRRFRTSRGPADDTGVAQYRYGVVLLLVLITVVFAIVAPDGNLSRAIAFALVGAALLVAICTSRERTVVLRRRAVIGGAAVALITVLTALGVLPSGATLGVAAVMSLAVPATLAGGLLRLVRERGATLQAVAGGIAIYLLLGLAFASAIGFVEAVTPNTYFAQDTNATAGIRVYYSFTVLTTTGFGDFTAAHGVGRALAVVEMLIGQIYLVTVISILIGRRIEQSRA